MIVKAREEPQNSLARWLVDSLVCVVDDDQKEKSTGRLLIISTWRRTVQFRVSGLLGKLGISTRRYLARILKNHRIAPRPQRRRTSGNESVTPLRRDGHGPKQGFCDGKSLLASWFRTIRRRRVLRWPATWAVRLVAADCTLCALPLPISEPLLVKDRSGACNRQKQNGVVSGEMAASR